MKLGDKVVTEIPLKELWTEKEMIQAERGKYLSKDELTELLKKHPVPFVIANVGQPLRWMSSEKCYEAWQSEIKTQVAQNLERIELETFPGEFAYVASLWTQNNSSPIVLLETQH